MRRKSVWYGLGIVLLLGGIAATLLILVFHEPEVYRKTAVPAGPLRKKHSNEFQSEFVRFIGSVINNERDWNEEFTEEQINSYFAEDFIQSGLAEKNLPENIRAPRIAIEADKIRLAFRYGVEPWSTVITIDLRLWLTSKEPNVVALEIQGLHAGALPIAAQSLLERVSEAGRGHDIEVSWYRLDSGNPVALLRFQADQKQPTVQLQRLELHQGRMVIGGRSIEASPIRAMLNPQLATKPAAN
jgi:hypothetical protein